MVMQITATRIVGPINFYEQIDVWHVRWDGRTKIRRVWAWKGPVG